MTITPITPDEIVEEQSRRIPEKVIGVYNDLLVREWDGSRAIIYQDEVINDITAVMDISRDEVFRRKYLNIECIFKKVGWKVKYNKPAYGEEFKTNFLFTK